MIMSSTNGSIRSSSMSSSIARRRPTSTAANGIPKKLSARIPARSERSRKSARARRRGASTSARITFSMERKARRTSKKMSRDRSANMANRSGAEKSVCTPLRTGIWRYECLGSLAPIARASWTRSSSGRWSRIESRRLPTRSPCRPTRSTPRGFLLAVVDQPEITGVLHLCNTGECTWQQYGQHALECAAAVGLPLRTRQVEAIRLEDMKAFVARRPIYTPLATDKFTQLTGIQPRSWQEAVEEYVRSRSGAFQRPLVNKWG